MRHKVTKSTKISKSECNGRNSQFPNFHFFANFFMFLRDFVVKLTALKNKYGTIKLSRYGKETALPSETQAKLYSTSGDTETLKE